MNGSKSDKQFLKSLCVFFVTLLICIAVFVGVGASVLITNRNTDGENTQSAENVVAKSDSAETVLIIEIDKKVYLNRIRFAFSENKYSCTPIEDRPVFSIGKSQTFSEHYKNSGTAGLLLALKEYYNRDFKYLCLSKDALCETVDAFGGVLINGNSARLMGLQAVKYTKNEKTATAVANGLLSAYFGNYNGKGIRNNYLTLLDTADTDLSYIDFYNHWDEIKNMEEG